MLRRPSQNPHHDLPPRPGRHGSLGHDGAGLREKLHLHRRQHDLAGHPQFPSSSRLHAGRTRSGSVGISLLRECSGFAPLRPDATR